MMTNKDFINRLEESIKHGWNDEKLTGLFEDLQDELSNDAYTAGFSDGYNQGFKEAWDD